MSDDHPSTDYCCYPYASIHATMRILQPLDALIILYKNVTSRKAPIHPAEGRVKSEAQYAKDLNGVPKRECSDGALLPNRTDVLQRWSLKQNAAVSAAQRSSLAPFVELEAYESDLMSV